MAADNTSDVPVAQPPYPQIPDGMNSSDKETDQIAAETKTLPQKRGRGRPPKGTKVTPAAPKPSVGPPRPRGRPPKDPEARAPPAPKAASSGRGRGRPPKKVKTDVVKKSVATDGVKRGRGRPPKAKAEE